jgi:hypothetical protein
MRAQEAANRIGRGDHDNPQHSDAQRDIDSRPVGGCAGGRQGEKQHEHRPDHDGELTGEPLDACGERRRRRLRHLIQERRTASQDQQCTRR